MISGVSWWKGYRIIGKGIGGGGGGGRRRQRRERGRRR